MKSDSQKKILCVGVNYRPHIEEMGREIPEHPVVFTRFASSLVGHGEPVIRPRVSEQFDFEGELAVVIGKTARYVSRESALDYVGGYCCFLDGSVRDWQRHTMQFTAGKNFEKSGAMPRLLASLGFCRPADTGLLSRFMIVYLSTLDDSSDNSRLADGIYYVRSSKKTPAPGL